MEKVADTIKSVNDLKVYRMAYKLAMDIFRVSKSLPKEEMFSLTDQIRRFSRSVVINIREGYAKRAYELVFVRHLIDALGSSEETRGWLDLSYDSGYISEEDCRELNKSYGELSAMLNVLSRNWRSYKDSKF